MNPTRGGPVGKPLSGTRHPEYLVTTVTHKAGGQWLLSEVSGLEAVLSLPSIACELALTEVYRKVTFPEGSGRR